MFRKENRLSGLKIVVLLGALLLARPSGLVAQHGGGGGHIGGGTTGGGGLSGEQPVSM
jgi:hypothetical protein